MEAKEAFTVLSDSKARTEYDRQQQVRSRCPNGLQAGSLTVGTRTSLCLECRLASTGVALVSLGDRHGSGRRPPQKRSNQRRSSMGSAISSGTLRKNSASDGDGVVVSQEPCSRSLLPWARASSKTL